MVTGYEVKAYHDLHAIAVALNSIAKSLERMSPPPVKGKSVGEFFPLNPPAPVMYAYVCPWCADYWDSADPKDTCNGCGEEVEPLGPTNVSG